MGVESCRVIAIKVELFGEKQIHRMEVFPDHTNMDTFKYRALGLVLGMKSYYKGVLADYSFYKGKQQQDFDDSKIINDEGIKEDDMITIVENHKKIEYLKFALAKEKEAEASQQKSHEVATSKNEANQEESKWEDCQFCNEPKELVYELIPCGHACVCGDCENSLKLKADQQKECPVCKQNFTEVVKKS